MRTPPRPASVLAYLSSRLGASFGKSGTGLAIGLFLSAAPSAARVEWRKPLPASGFSGLQQEFRRLATERGTAKVNHFCAVIRGDTSGGGDRSLEVYWPEGHQFLRYGPGTDGKINALSQDAGATVDLRTDVVATERDIAGSTSRVTRAYVMALITRCRQTGTTFTVLRGRKG